MSNEVYANGEAIACKSGDGKVIAAFPDVCLSPPSPPAGPIPLPYPNTSFSKDMKEGSKTVKIDGKEVMLKDKSYYKTSPLGDEAATRSFGGSVITHTITGKTYFTAWSMDVKVEGENVDRHVDLTTSNHNPYPGSTPPMVNAEKVALAEERIAENQCPCCGKPRHAWQQGAPQNMEEWYLANNRPADHADLRTLLADARNRPNCTCKSPKKKSLLPSPPCDVFYPPPNPRPPARTAREADWRRKTRARQRAKGVPAGAALTAHATQRFQEKNNGRTPNPAELADEERLQTQQNHLTPKIAGGCNKEGNTQANFALCASCQQIDARFNRFQQAQP